MDFKTHIEHIIRASTHFVKNADPQRTISNGYPECVGNNANFRGLVSKYYSLMILTQEVNFTKFIDRYGDLLAGIAFPQARSGEKIRIQTGGRLISELTINDNNKFYLPIYDCQMFSLVSTQFSCTKIFTESNNMPIYLIYVLLDHPFRMYLAQNSWCVRIPSQNLYLCYFMGKAHYKDEGAPIQLNTLGCFATKIQRTWRVRKKYFLQHFKKWKAVCREIEAFPGRGIHYFEGSKEI